jgi:hypothetical protein
MPLRAHRTRSAGVSFVAASARTLRELIECSPLQAGTAALKARAPRTTTHPNAVAIKLYRTPPTTRSDMC